MNTKQSFKEFVEKIFAEHNQLGLELVGYITRLQSQRMMQANKTINFMKKDGYSAS